MPPSAMVGGKGGLGTRGSFIIAAPKAGMDLMVTSPLAGVIGALD